MSTVNSLLAIRMIPHGHCYLWQSDLVALHVAADAITAIAYYSIPMVLLFLKCRRDNLPFNGLFLLSGGFILACGTVHAMEIWTLWHPNYWTFGILKAIMALVSVWAAAALIPVIKQVIQLPKLVDVESANQQLRQEIAERKRVEMALKRAEAQKEAVVSHIKRRLASRQIRILIIDDFEGDRLHYRRHLRGDGLYSYEFIEAEDSAEGLKLASAHQPDIIFLDYRLPDSEGLETLMALRQQHPGVFPAIIMLTGQGDEEIAVSAIKSGAAEYLVKNRLTNAKLTASVHRVLQQQQLQLELNRSQRRRQLISDSALRVHQSMDLQETLTIAAHDIRQVLGCEQVGICKIVPVTLDDSSGPTLVAQTVSGPGALRPAQVDIPRSSTLVPGSNEVPSQILVPIVLSQEGVDCQCCTSWGLLLANYELGHKPSSEDLDILSELAVQLGISLQQTALLEQLQDELIERRKAEQNLAAAQKSLEQINQNLERRIQERTALLTRANQQLENEVEQRRQAEAALREQEHQLRLFVKYAPAAVAMLDSNLHYMVHSQRWLEDYGLDHQSILGHSHFEVFPKTPERWKVNYQRCLAGEVLACDEDSFTHADGRVDWLRWELHPWYTETGYVGGLIILTEIITEKKRLQQTVIAQQEMLQSFFDAASSANIGTAILDQEFRYLKTNQALANIDGLSPEEHVGKLVKEVVPDIAVTVLPLFEQVVNDHAVIQQEVTGLSPLDPGSPRCWLASFFPIYSDAHQLKQLGLVTLEITQQKQNERQLETLNDDLQRSNKELEHFAYVASHDLREPLRKVRSYCDLLAKRYEGQLDERADKYIHYITDGSMRMMQLINDLLDYSRVGRGALNPEVLPLEPLLKQVISDLQNQIQATQAEIHVCERLPVLSGNSVQLRQLFQNLIGNSLKYRSEAPPKITVDASVEGTFWQISVTDNGIGIPSEFAERIFVVFQRLHVREAYEGTGIGLAVCKRIVEHHGGKIWVESQPGAGATFHFTLPAASMLEANEPSL